MDSRLGGVNLGLTCFLPTFGFPAQTLGAGEIPGGLTYFWGTFEISPQTLKK